MTITLLSGMRFGTRSWISRQAGAVTGEPDPFVINTQNYRYGFLSAALRRTLNQALGSPLDQEDIRRLRLAKEFLSNVLAGARLVSRGETRAVSATQAMDALTYALGPLQAIETLRQLSQENLFRLFGDMLSSIDASIEAQQLKGEEQTLRTAAAFFAGLNDSILSALNREPKAGPAVM